MREPPSLAGLSQLNEMVVVVQSVTRGAPGASGTVNGYLAVTGSLLSSGSLMPYWFSARILKLYFLLGSRLITS